MTKPRITISLPCYKRPERTIRAIKSILDQTIDGWELLITGDSCPDFERPEFIELIHEIKHDQYYNSGNIIVCKNNQAHGGNWGTDIRNQHIKEATGKLFMFMGSDDVLLPNHLENKLRYIEGADLDFIYFDTWIEPNNAPRNAQLEHGSIGHSELIVRTNFLRQMPKHQPFYGHDWKLVANMIIATSKYEKAIGAPQTYIVKSIPEKEEIGID